VRDAAGIRRALLAWYDANRRDLPWRQSRDPYAIWISEAMLQQTRVETVIPYYERFLGRFPDVRALATADMDDVLSVWAGLGYYSRARNLRAAAQEVVERHGAQLPGDAEALRSLPGIGRYTAGAVASIAFDRPEPVLDGNVKRVLARLLALREDVKRADVTERLWAEAGELAAGPRPGDLNQALMELGALRCTPRSPDCGACPLSRRCAARRAGDPESIPLRTPRRAVPRVEAAAALVVRGGRALAVRRPPRGLMGGLWELPGDDLAAREAPARGLRRALRERVGLDVGPLRKAGSVEHVFSHRRLRLYVYRCEAQGGRVRLAGPDAHRWLAPSRLNRLPQATLTRKALELLLQ
jgi:A/G-specific adenine glycosylase